MEVNNNFVEELFELEDELKVLQLEGSNVENAKETVHNLMANIYVG